MLPALGVEDLQTHTYVDVLVNQYASAGPNQFLNVGGSGMMQPITNAAGKIVAVGFDKNETATIEANATGRDISGQNDAKSAAQEAIAARATSRRTTASEPERAR